MNLKEWRLLIITAYFFTLIAIYLPIITKAVSNNGNDFVAMEILGFNGTTANYFKNTESKVNSGDIQQWTIDVNNYTPDYRAFQVRARIEKSETNPLDYVTNGDNNVIIFNKSVAVDTRSMIRLQFNWDISWNSSEVYTISVNEHTPIILTDFNKGNYKIKFELMANDENNTLNPNIIVDGKEYNIWNQINFVVN